MTAEPPRDAPHDPDAGGPTAFADSRTFLVILWLLGGFVLATPWILAGLCPPDAEDAARFGVAGWIVILIAVGVYVAFAALLVRLTRDWVARRRYWR